MYLSNLVLGSTPFTLNLGGFACVRPKEWSKHLLEQIRKLSPEYLQNEAAGMALDSQWKENACILEALDQYLFDQFGFALPENNIFKVFNKDGEGIPAKVVLEVVTSLIEPFGFEVDQVIVPDDELRQEVGSQNYVVGEWGAPAFEGKPGICMINIREGYSHAFFWKRMNTRKFQKFQFRMALTIKRVDQWDANRSARESIDLYCALLTEYLAYIGPDCKDQVRLDILNHEIRLLRRYMNNPRFRVSGKFRITLERKLNAICNLLQEMNFCRDGSEEEIIRVVEKLVRRIVKEADEHALTRV